MSWDIYVQDLPEGIKTVEEIPEDFHPGLIGRRRELIAEIKAVVPEADFSDPSWGRVEGPDFSIEFNMGDDEEVVCLALHVRGSEGAVGLIAAVLDRLGLQALAPDSETGLFEAEETARESFARWRSYRDTVVVETGN